MTRQILHVLCILSALATSWAVPFEKRWDSGDVFNGEHLLKGVEVNGLFNPMERYSNLIHVANGPVLPRISLNELPRSMATD